MSKKSKSKKPNPDNVFAQNKKAYHDYEILEEFEAGIQLFGDEVKSIRLHQANLKGSYVQVFNEEAFMTDAHISPYKFSSRPDLSPTRKRKLILRKKEIRKIEQELNTAGVTAIPLKLYKKGGLIKLKLGLCRGKKLHDKRETLKLRSQDRELKRQLKNY